MRMRTRFLHALLLGGFALGLGAPAWAARFSEARIFVEYNSSANDLGFHVSLDGEDWTSLRIVDPAGTGIFEVEGKGPYRQLGMTELFFEGAEPSLDEFPLEDLLALLPEGRYKFIGTTVDGVRLESRARLSHAVPAVVGYQVIVDPSFQVTLPATSTQVTLPREFVQSLAPGLHPFEVLAIDVSGNQTIPEGAFVTQ